MPHENQILQIHYFKVNLYNYIQGHDQKLLIPIWLTDLLNMNWLWERKQIRFDFWRENI